MFVNPGLSVLIISVQFAYSISNRFQNIGYENKRHRLTAFVPVLTKKVWNIQEYNAGCHLVEIKMHQQMHSIKKVRHDKV